MTGLSILKRISAIFLLFPAVVCCAALGDFDDDYLVYSSDLYMSDDGNTPQLFVDNPSASDTFQLKITFPETIIGSNETVTEDYVRFDTGSPYNRILDGGDLHTAIKNFCENETDYTCKEPTGARILILKWNNDTEKINNQIYFEFSGEGNGYIKRIGILGQYRYSDLDTK